MEQAEVYAALGMDMPAEQPEAAEPAADASTGANGQPVTGAAAGDPETREPDGGTGDPSLTGDEAGRSPAAPGKASPTGGDIDGRTGDPSPTDGGPAPMSKAERAEQARLRRERETQARIDAALKAQQEKFDAQLKEVFDAAGLTNRYRDGAKIQTAEDFAQWKKDFSDLRLAERLQSGELTAEDFRAAVDASPALQEVRALAEQLKAGQAQAQRQEMDRVVADELAQIREKFDPTVGSLADILNGRHGERFAQLVNEHGLSFVDAYKLAYGDEIAATKQKAAAIGAARSAQSKAHMVALGQNSSDGVRVPTATRAIYKELFPSMTDAEIQASYAKYHKK